MNDSASKIIVIYIKKLKVNAIKYSELVYPVHHKGGPPVDGDEGVHYPRHQPLHKPVNNQLKIK